MSKISILIEKKVLRRNPGLFNKKKTKSRPISGIWSAFILKAYLADHSLTPVNCISYPIQFEALTQGLYNGLLSMPLVWKQTKSLKLVCFWSSFCWKVYFLWISHKIMIKRCLKPVCVSALMCRCKPSQELTPKPFQQQLASTAAANCQVSHHFQLIYGRFYQSIISSFND